MLGTLLVRVAGAPVAEREGNMTKLMPSDSCANCDHFYYVLDHSFARKKLRCKLANRPLETWRDIPGWCPLQDADADPLAELLAALRGDQVADFVSVEFHRHGDNATLYARDSEVSIKDQIYIDREAMLSLLLSDQPEPKDTT